MDTIRRNMPGACWIIALAAAVGTSAASAQSTEDVNASAAAAMMGEPEQAVMAADFDPSDLIPLPEVTRVTRWEGAPGQSPQAVSSTALVDKLIYSSTLGTLIYPPGVNRAIADDIVTDAIDVCDLRKYIVRVNGGVPNGTGDFTARVDLMTACPYGGAGGVLIPGTQVLFTDLPNDITEIHELVVDLSSMPIEIPPRVWLRVMFNTSTAGWVVGAPPERGFSADAYAHPFTGCNTWFGGYSDRPHATFYSQFYADETCETHHLAYAATSPTLPAFVIPGNRRVADDINIANPDGFCELSAYEVGFRGEAGAYNVEIDLRQPFALGPIPGTAFTFSGRGERSLEVARYTVPANETVFITNPTWVSWKPDRGSTGAVNARRNQAGFSTPQGFQFDAPGFPGAWQPFISADLRTPFIFYVVIYCRGEAPRGACCPDQPAIANQPPICIDDLPVTSCLNARWLGNQTCAQNTFSPPCGTHACCMPNDECSDLNFDACQAIKDSNTPVVRCQTNDDCPQNRQCVQDLPCGPGLPPCPRNSTCQNNVCTDGPFCSLRTGIWRPGQFCGFNLQRCPIYQCFFGTGDCLSGDTQIDCPSGEDFECPGEQRCMVPPEAFNICSARLGCGNLDCCDTVCRFDPQGGTGRFCCQVQWDATCAQLAQEFCSVAPGNDFCSDPSPNRGLATITINPATGAGFVNANNRGGTGSATDPLACCNKRGGDIPVAGTLWYEFTMPTIGTPPATTARIHTCFTPGSTDPLDSILEVFSVGNSTNESTTCSSLTIIGCNDDSPTCGGGSRFSDVCVQGLQPGQKYVVMIGSPTGDGQGPFRLDVAVPCPRVLPVNNSCGAATALPSNMSQSVPFNLQNSTVSCPTEFCTDDAGVDVASTMGNDIWYEIFAPCTGAMRVETCDANPSPLTDPPTSLVVYQITNPANPCPPLASNVVGCNNDAPVSPADFLVRPQACEFSGTCSGNGAPCDPVNVCPDGQTCVKTSCQTDTNCKRVCSVTSEVCNTAADCNFCQDTGTACLVNADCFTCGVGGALCTSAADCPQGVGCSFTQNCITTGQTCVQEDCISSCGASASTTVPVFVGAPYQIRLGGDFGATPSGNMSITCQQHDCNNNNVPDLIDFQTGVLKDCNRNNIGDSCEIAQNAALDCNNNGIPDRCEIDIGSTAPGGPFFCLTNCQPDCDNNGRIDSCDLAACISSPGCMDCNANGQLDRCDIADGTSQDANTNGIPDECEGPPCVPPDCNDNNVCTTDVCVAGVCQHTPIQCPPGEVCHPVNGCGPAAQCTGIASMVPPNCEIDARQPHDLNDQGLVFGESSFQLTFNAGCDAGTLTPGSFTVSAVPGPAPAPTIQSVVGAGNVATVTFSGPIPPQNWTCVTHTASGNQKCFGYLPGDVNASRGSTAADINALINSLNNVPGFVRPLFATDANRSGGANASDILRVIDLLNGAQAFDPWLNRSLPVCPSP